ncbi:hypothetical protein [Lentzea aerocolonigenes]|uniref:hypothetical protein n=1 Tax=Lentzea aerocolonigenes TaxID=68170 RepID=UPI0012E1A9BC|nr:hypothetical protein [Lentzea aerocolonigenes]
MSSRTLPALGSSSAGSFRGRGLVLVEQVARRWGVLTAANRKTVCAEFSLDAAGHSA